MWCALRSTTSYWQSAAFVEPTQGRSHNVCLNCSQTVSVLSSMFGLNNFHTYSTNTVKAIGDPPPPKKKVMTNLMACAPGLCVSVDLSSPTVSLMISFLSLLSLMDTDSLSMWKLTFMSSNYKEQSNNHISDPEVCILMLVIYRLSVMESKTEVYHKLTVGRQGGK